MNADYMATAGNYRELYSLKTNYLQLGFAFMTEQQSSKEMNCRAVPAAPSNTLPHSPQPEHFCLIGTFTFLGPKINSDVRENAFNWGAAWGSEGKSKF